MHILVVTATDAEVAPFIAGLGAAADAGPRVRTYARGGHGVDVLTTGVGMVATAAWCSRALAQGRYGLALNLGVCGSFDRAFAPGAVVHVATDCIAELGAEDDDAFLTIQDLQLLGKNEFPFHDGRVVNGAPPANVALSQLPAVDGITVNTVHGNERSIAAVARRFSPQVESMEGAAFMYACMVHGLPFAQVRAVSNVVERRNRGAWKLTDAIANLGEAALAVVDRA